MARILCPCAIAVRCRSEYVRILWWCRARKVWLKFEVSRFTRGANGADSALVDMLCFAGSVRYRSLTAICARSAYRAAPKRQHDL